MFDRDKWQEILASLSKHKLRTALTALGVFWGVFMLVFVLGMGKGLENGVVRGFGARAKNVMYVWVWRTSLPYKGFKAGRIPRMNFQDIEAIKNNIAEVEFIAPRLSLNAPVVHKDISDNYEIRGELEDMIKIEALQVFEGRYINPMDIEERRKVAVLGKRTAEVFFGKDDPIGKSIRIRGIEFRVVGVFGPLEIKPWTESDMEAVVIPMTTMHRTMVSGERVDYFVCSSQPNVRVSEAEVLVKNLLKERHSIDPNDPQGIGSFNLEENFQQITGLFLGIESLLWFVGVCTLLAGILGVSNIMLITVKERTKEIGIRKALGATPRSIINMVLTESIFITSLSGYLGLVFGTLIIGGINFLMVSNNVENQNFHNPQVNIYVGIAAIVMLIISGALAGLIPANHAARIKPVVALKDE